MDSEDERVGRAARMLLGGATLLAQPCPYCSGVRVIKDGYALCVSCGQEPERRDGPDRVSRKKDSWGGAKVNKAENERMCGGGNGNETDQIQECITDALEAKLVELSGKLAAETDRRKEIEILDSINAALAALQKAKQFQQD